MTRDDFAVRITGTVLAFNVALVAINAGTGRFGPMLISMGASVIGLVSLLWQMRERDRYRQWEDSRE